MTCNQLASTYIYLPKPSLLFHVIFRPPPINHAQHPTLIHALKGMWTNISFSTAYVYTHTYTHTHRQHRRRSPHTLLFPRVFLGLIFLLKLLQDGMREALVVSRCSPSLSPSPLASLPSLPSPPIPPDIPVIHCV